MTLRIIGAGFGRTGTNSLKLALEQLGVGPCHHMFEVRDNPAQLRKPLADLQKYSGQALTGQPTGITAGLPGSIRHSRKSEIRSPADKVAPILVPC